MSENIPEFFKKVKPETWTVSKNAIQSRLKIHHQIRIQRDKMKTKSMKNKWRFEKTQEKRSRWRTQKQESG